MTARGVFWVAGELAGADFVHPVAGDALDGENFWLSIEPQVPDEGRTSRRRDVSMAFATAKNPFHDGSGLPTTLPRVGLFCCGASRSAPK